MSRVHAVAALAALGVHALIAVPWLRRWLRHEPPVVNLAATEIPIDASLPTAEQHRNRTLSRRAETAPTQQPAAKALADVNPAKISTHPAKSKGVVSGDSSPTSVLADTQPFGSDARALLLVHTAGLRNTALGLALEKRLTARQVLTPLFVGAQLEALRDFDRLLLSQSKSGATSAALQYNVPRYRIRAAAYALGENAYSLPARQLLLVAPSKSLVDTMLKDDFRLPEPLADEALDAYFKTPTSEDWPGLVAVPSSLQRLQLRVSVTADGAGSFVFDALDSAGSPLSGHGELTRAELNLLAARLFDELGR